MNAPENGIFLSSEAQSLKDTKFSVTKAEGVERLSALYEWVVTFVVSPLSDIFDDEAEREFLASPVCVSPFRRENALVWGVVRSLTIPPHSFNNRSSVFEVQVVPRIWHATLTSRSRTFQDKTVVQLATIIFDDLRFENRIDYEFRLKKDYSPREYTVQYEESDFAFLSRLLEDEGLFYFFEQGDDREKIVIADYNNAGHDHAAVNTSDDARDSGWVMNIGIHRAIVPEELALRDYNWRDPAVELTATTGVSREGKGVRTVSDEHYRDPEVGRRLVTIRSEELRVPERQFTGQANRLLLRAGQRFSAEDWTDPRFNQTYFATEVHHAVSSVASESNFTTFVAIPNDVAFRPPRITPKPVIRGLVYATIDGEFDSTAAPVDARGCYKLRMAFDQSDNAPGQGSRWVRMAQPHGGPGYGLHFPLRRGTEVLVMHVGGDPDRPIIVAAVPNAQTPSPVNSRNPTQSVIQTVSGILVEMEDDA